VEDMVPNHPSTGSAPVPDHRSGSALQ